MTTSMLFTPCSKLSLLTRETPPTCICLTSATLTRKTWIWPISGVGSLCPIQRMSSIKIPPTMEQSKAWMELSTSLSIPQPATTSISCPSLFPMTHVWILPPLSMNSELKAATMKTHAQTPRTPCSTWKRLAAISMSNVRTPIFLLRLCLNGTALLVKDVWIPPLLNGKEINFHAKTHSATTRTLVLTTLWCNNATTPWDAKMSVLLWVTTWSWTALIRSMRYAMITAQVWKTSLPWIATSP